MATRERNRLDDVFDALNDRYRRRLLVALLDRASRMDTPEVPLERVVPGEPTEALEVRFYHVHLPKLAEMGFVEWDRETLAVSTGPAFEEVRPLLALIDEHGGELPGEWP